MNDNAKNLELMKKEYLDALDTSICDNIDKCKNQYFSTLLYNIETEIAYISYYPKRYITEKIDLTHVVQSISDIVDVLQENSYSYESLMTAFKNLMSDCDIKCFPELFKLINEHCIN